MWETWVQSFGQEDPLEKETEPTPVFLPGKSHRQRSLVGCSPWRSKELDTTEQLNNNLYKETASFSLPFKMQSKFALISSGLFFFNPLLSRESPFKQKEETDIFWIDRCQGTLPSNFRVD